MQDRSQVIHLRAKASMSEQSADTRYNLFGSSAEELEALVADFGLQRFRAEQIYRWMYAEHVYGFAGMTNLSKDQRERLSERFKIELPAIAGSSTSSDGTVKYLIELEDGLRVESVLIPTEDEDSEKLRRLTLCISTQVGCPLDCKFCATGSMKLKRNLTAGEIMGQYFRIQEQTGERISNIVYMGMGEPMLNYDAVMQSVEILTDERIEALGANRITISTAGLIPEIRRLADEGRKMKLAISLHTPDNAARTKLMPITKKYPVDELIAAAEYYYQRTRKRVTYEYILFEGWNDSAEDVQRLAKICRRFPSKVNLIPFHAVDYAFPEGMPLRLRAAAPETIESFAESLRNAGVTVMLRSSSGKDINAACGQLALQNENSG
ncbi:MAG: 23S rRNA (adenine(2503)-C(2))-methyltransferase RlmN [Ectothiorhodospiraceae bacterium]|nr:23S rRNA (adenine(2503)-C(2))-methyltransferase RlmN [Ectothiorhodospiraceae bacterium]